METQNSIQQLFFTFLSQYSFDKEDLDYAVADRHTKMLETLAAVSNSSVQVFDLHRREIIFFSSNYGNMLGYSTADYNNLNYQFFEGKMHPAEKEQLALNGIANLKIFNAFSVEEKLSHKVTEEYRMLNAEQKYIRVVEQYQVLELDKKGQLWLLLSILDISPNQENPTAIKRQLLNFKTGNFIQLDDPQAPMVELTRREAEILKLVQQGLLSKEISNQLSISVHTVNTHRQRVLEKLGANNSHEALVFAAKFGLLD